MNYLSRLLEWVTSLLGRRTPGRHSRTAALPVVPLVVRGRHARAAAPPAAPPRVVRDRPSPDVWGARPVAARMGRSRHTPPVPHPLWDTGSIVRPYVLHALASAPRTARAGVQVDPWGDVR
jgi:hypothetical protein